MGEAKLIPPDIDRSKVAVEEIQGDMQEDPTTMRGNIASLMLE